MLIIYLVLIISSFVHVESVFAVEGKNDILLAKIYDESIYQSDLDPTNIVYSHTKQNNSDSAGAIYNDELNPSLANIIWKKLAYKFLEVNNALPSETEIQGFMGLLQKENTRKIAELEGLKVAIHNSNSLNNSTPVSGNVQTPDLSKIDVLINEMETLHNARLNEDSQVYAADRKSAFNLIARWKFDRKLYLKYGGRVSFTNTTMQPIDAYKLFIDDTIHDETLVIYNHQYNNVFYDFYSFLNTFNNPVSSQQAKEYFSSPWWSSDKG